ncbi:hypothetical protein O181_046422 [Austropuccinia psidii MF-1]|uniref:Uncharacterized protein n=1 Tax=Austropuccinia psidii MF-1 TaxID=1389203 RepID=A0A9Q3DR84_9BASI|nr:hypothetical protein [Austropuccinia psidii MF-1]
MRQEHGQNDCLWSKSGIITKWANKHWRSKRENDFESAISNSENYKPLTLFLKQKNRVSALHPDLSDSMIDFKILRKCGEQLEHSIKCISLEFCEKEGYINSMEDIITMTRIGKNWTRNPRESKVVPKTSGEDKNLKYLS